MRTSFTATVCVALISVILQSPASFAARVEGLYETETPVPDKQSEERSSAFGTALRDVLIKLTGSRTPQLNATVAAAIRAPDRFVEQYQYRTLTLKPLDETELASQELLLWTRFDAAALHGLLSEAGLPVWGRIRPSILVWLALENESTRSLVGEDSGATLIGVLSDTASRRGLPLLVPRLDEQDRSAISVTDVWAGFEDRIAAASQRYQADSILVARGYRTGSSGWEVRWRFFVDGASSEWVEANSRLDVLLADGVERAADRLAARYANIVVAAADERVELVVDSIRSVNDFARTIRYLQGLDGVSRVDVTALEADRVSLSLEARGGLPRLAQMISFGRTLARVQSAEGLQYRLGP